MNYSWVSGVEARCRCGKMGTWLWLGTQGFLVDHSGGDARGCTLEAVTAREERELRIAVGRKRPY